MVWQDYIPEDIKALYEIHEHERAIAVLATNFAEELRDLSIALRELCAGEQDAFRARVIAPRCQGTVSRFLRPLGWTKGHLQIGIAVNGNFVPTNGTTYKLNYVRGRVAFLLNLSKRGRNFWAQVSTLRKFFEFDRIDVAVILVAARPGQRFLVARQLVFNYIPQPWHAGPRAESRIGHNLPVLLLAPAGTSKSADFD